MKKICIVFLFVFIYIICYCLRFLNLRLVHTEPPSITWQIFYPGTGSCSGFHSWISAPVGHDSLYLPACLSNLGDNGLPCDLSSFMDPRIFIDFSVCSDFYLLWRLFIWSGDFQVPYMLNQKMELFKDIFLTFYFLIFVAVFRYDVTFYTKIHFNSLINSNSLSKIIILFSAQSFAYEYIYFYILYTFIPLSLAWPYFS